MNVHYMPGTLHLSEFTMATILLRYAYYLHFEDAEIGKERLLNPLKATQLVSS